MTDTEPQATPSSTPGPITPAPDLSQYIRTYAKDVALVSGKGNVGALPKAKPAPEPVAAPAEPTKPRGEVSDGVEFDATEQPFFEATHKREENPYAPVELESRAELDSFVEGKSEAAAVLQKAEQERSEVLARLRAKMAVPNMATPVADVVPSQKKEVPVPVVPPPPPAPKPIPPPPVAPPVPKPVAPPTFVAQPVAPVYAMPPLYREPITEVEAPKVAPILPRVAPTPPPVVSAEAPSRFHSFSSDFKDRTNATQSSSFSVLAAGLDAGQAVSAPRQTRTRERPPVLVFVAGAVLLVLAAGGSYAAYLYVGARHVVPVITLSVPSLIFADEYKKLEGSGSELLQELATTASNPLTPGTAMVTYVTQPPTGETGVVAGTPASGGVLIKALALPAPELLLRNIDESSTVGVINEGGDTRTFFVLRVSSYERTFAGMLTWEPLMNRDLGPLYPLYALEAAPTPTVDLSTASSTASTTTSSTTPIATTTQSLYQDKPVVSVGRFEDAIVANRDVRILRDTRGRSLMLYGYADKQTLIIARNEAAFSALLVRLSAGSN